MPAAAYQKYVDLNPTDAALAWRNFGTVLYNSNRMKESIEPLQKATTLDPKNATAWLLLGIALVNTMEFKTVGDKITPVMQARHGGSLPARDRPRSERTDRRAGQAGPRFAAGHGRRHHHESR